MRERGPRTQRVFRRVDTDRYEWRSDDGRWLIEKAITEGPRGGKYVRWHLYRVAERLQHVATEPRLRDIWGHIDA